MHPIDRPNWGYGFASLDFAGDVDDNVMMMLQVQGSSL